MKLEFLTNSPLQTKKIGKILAKEILFSTFPRKTGLVIGLIGDLGGGKTTFLQGFAKGLKIKEKILSPSFVIMRKFKIENSKFRFFYHIDYYRIQKLKEILDLRLKEISSNPKNIVAIEWAGKIRKIMPKSTIWLRFEFVDQKIRKITLNEKFKMKKQKLPTVRIQQFKIKK